MSYIFNKSNIIFIIYFLFISKTLSEPMENELKINVNYTGSMSSDESREYYKLIIPSDIKSNTSILTFILEENKENITDGDEIFSDPDMYISKKNEKPENGSLAEWWSERYGNDIITIPKNEINPNDTFYICMYCQFKCKYKLRINLSSEIEIKIGRVYTSFIKKNSYLNYYIKIDDKDYTEMNVVATNAHLHEFKIFMHRDSPSNQNSYPVIPVWAGGYMISVNNSNEYYCKNCTYHILIQSGNEDVRIQFYAYFQNSITSLINGQTLYDAVRATGHRCYSFDFEKRLRNEKIIIQTTLFSGNGLLHIGGFNDISFENLGEKKGNYSYEITSEKLILLDKKDYEQFDKDKNFNNNYNSDKLIYCIYSRHTCSYSTSIYFLSQTEKNQKNNILMPNREIQAYLYKGHVTSYRVIDFGYITNNLKNDIKLIFSSVQGDTKFYGYYCKNFRCYLNRTNLNTLISQYKIINPKSTGNNEYNIEILNNDNECYDLEKNVNNDTPCTLTAIISCEINNTTNVNDDNNYCIYKIRANVVNIPLSMTPKKTYYSIIPAGKKDLYEITITDEEINSIVVVLNTASGDAELIVFFEENQTQKIAGISLNNDYIPDVVRITPSRLKKDNLVGKYIVQVIASSFSSYNVYYYTTSNKKNETVKYTADYNDIVAKIKEGEILTDYFPNDIFFKIYSFEAAHKGTDIKMIINRVNVKFIFKVFTDLSKFEFNPIPKNPFEERLKGYLWSSDFNGELIINNDDENFTNGTYYIVVLKDKYNTEDQGILNENSLMQFYLGVTVFKNPFTLLEGMSHFGTLDERFIEQSYWYLHNNISQNLEIVIDLFYGDVEMYVDVKKIDSIEFSKFSDSFKSLTNISQNSKSSNNNNHIILNTEYFNNYCPKNNNNNTCNIYICIVNTQENIKLKKKSQFQIHIIAGNDSYNLLTPGTVLRGSLESGKRSYFIIEEVQKRNFGSINVNFENGFGEIYVRIPKVFEHGENLIFPNETNFDYKGEYSYLGKSIMIPKEEYEKLNNEENSILQIIITVVAEEKYEMNKTVDFTISYSNEIKRINQNVPYYNFISSGEKHFFVFYFDENVDNIYISLSNMNGDADMFLNYGNEILPSSSYYTWSSTALNHEHIDIKKDDPYFKKNNITIGGYYTLLVIGFTDTSYTLFVSNYNINVKPLQDNLPSYCSCNEKGEKCYFRYDDVYNMFMDTNYTEIIFTSSYSYGNGIMYVKLMKDYDLNLENKNVYVNFPDEKNYDITNYDSNQRNYIKFKVDGDNYNKETLLLMTFVCEEKTFVNINSASLNFDGLNDYLDLGIENMYHIKYNNESDNEYYLNFYNYKGTADIIYHIHSYIGSAKISIYVNDTVYDKEKKEYKDTYKHIFEFIIQKDATVFNTIPDSPDIREQNIQFKIQPQSDFSFFIQINYEEKYIKIPIGETKSYIVKKKGTYGYFDIINEFKNIEFSCNIINNSNKRIRISLTINKLKKPNATIFENNTNDNEAVIYDYKIPSFKTAEYKGITDKVLGSINILLENLPELTENEKKEGYFIRALFYLEIIVNKNEDNNNNDEDEDEIDIELNEDEDDNIYDTEVSLLVSPNLNNNKRIEALPYEYYRTINKEQNNNEIKIYSLTRQNDDDKYLIIEISSCSNKKFQYLIFDSLKNVNDNHSNVLVEEINLFGKFILMVKNINKKHYYLKIWKKDDYCVNIANGICDLNYLMYYYTTKEDYLLSTTSNLLTYKEVSNNQIKLIIPNLNNKNDLKFDIVITTNPSYHQLFSNICFLSKSQEENRNDIKFFKNVEINPQNEILLKKLPEKKKSFVVNVLIQNTKTKELITFTPLLITVSSSYNLSSWQTVFIYLFICALLVVIAYLLYICFRQKKIIEIERSDIRNMATVPTSESEMIRMREQSDKTKYSTLSDNAESV